MRENSARLKTNDRTGVKRGSQSLLIQDSTNARASKMWAGAISQLEMLDGQVSANVIAAVMVMFCWRWRAAGRLAEGRGKSMQEILATT